VVYSHFKGGNTAVSTLQKENKDGTQLHRKKVRETKNRRKKKERN
jgi:hypothetical protein